MPRFSRAYEWRVLHGAAAEAKAKSLQGAAETTEFRAARCGNTETYAPRASICLAAEQRPRAVTLDSRSLAC